MRPYSRRLSDGSSVVQVTVNDDETAEDADGPAVRTGARPSSDRSEAEIDLPPVLVSAS